MTTSRPTIARNCLAAMLIILASVPATAADSTDSLLAKIGIQRGICVVLGAGSDAIALDLARQSELLVYVQLSDPLKATALREAAEQFSGTRLKRCCEEMEQSDENGQRTARRLRELAEHGDFERISELLMESGEADERE